MPNCLQFGLLLALCVCCVDTQNVTKNLPSYEILTFDFSAIETPFVVASWLAIASGVKILFHFIRPLSKYFPDSSLLVFVGFALGWILHYGIESIKAEYYQLESVYFFHFLLPPIIFDAGYFMPNRALFENFGSVMLFAVIGTVWNTIAIGGGLYLLSLYGLFSIPFDAFEVLTFTSLISAVDPVAVIAVFEEVHVNEFLFINVFGEALFNDAVSVVLYKMFKNFYDIGPERVEIADYGKGVVSFFAIAVGGTAVGIIFAFVVAIVTKFSDHIRILAPIFVFVVPYMAYLLADSMGMSSILAISVCGMVMKQYVKGNLTPAATNSVKYFTKMLAVGAETLLFMFLGVSAIVTPHHFDWAFISITVAFCLIFRSIGVMVQCAILNKFRKKKFSLVDQFILSYGGLRGAIAFGLSVSLPDSMAAKPMFVTTTIAVIYFTVLLQGITIRPIVNWLKVERSDGRQKTMTESVFMKYIDYTMSGVEEIFGIRGEHYIRDTYERINAKILRPILMRNEEKKDFDASVIVRAYAKITLEEALALKEHLPKKKKIDKKNALQSDKRNLSSISFDSSTSTGDPSPELPYKRRDTIHQLVEDPASVEMLYSLFSDLLDRKLHDVTKQKKITEPEELQDDYMAQMTVSNLRSLQAAPASSSTNQQTRQYSAPFSANTNQVAPEGRRMSEGSFQKKNANYNV